MTEDSRTLWDAEAAAFDDAADHGLRDPDVRRAWADLLLPLIADRGRHVADLGCGTGTLSLLLADEGGHFVTGIDFSPEMIRRAREKADGTIPTPVFTVADAALPPLPAGSFDVVISRHVLWAMPDPAAALQKWIDLLTPTGTLILIEGRWHTGVGLTADACLELVSENRNHVELRMLDDPSYWGGPTSDERYLIISRSWRERTRRDSGQRSDAGQE
jgi:SAM-dependent methyltransferase